MDSGRIHPVGDNLSARPDRRDRPVRLHPVRSSRTATPRTACSRARTSMPSTNSRSSKKARMSCGEVWMPLSDCAGFTRTARMSRSSCSSSFQASRPDRSRSRNSAKTRYSRNSSYPTSSPPRRSSIWRPARDSAPAVPTTPGDSRPLRRPTAAIHCGTTRSAGKWPSPRSASTGRVRCSGSTGRTCSSWCRPRCSTTSSMPARHAPTVSRRRSTRRLPKDSGSKQVRAWRTHTSSARNPFRAFRALSSTKASGWPVLQGGPSTPASPTPDRLRRRYVARRASITRITRAAQTSSPRKIPPTSSFPHRTSSRCTWGWITTTRGVSSSPWIISATATSPCQPKRWTPTWWKSITAARPRTLSLTFTERF